MANQVSAGDRERIEAIRKRLRVAQQACIDGEVDIFNMAHHASWEDTAFLLDLLASQGAIRAQHRCSGCGHHWSFPEGFRSATGAELCGDCWRKAQPVLHTRVVSVPGVGQWDLPRQPEGVVSATAPECVWAMDDVGGESMWETACKQAFEFTDGEGPLANGLRFCGYCGKPLREARTSEDNDE